MVVFPAPSRPRIKIRRSFVPHNLENMLENSPPVYSEINTIMAGNVVHMSLYRVQTNSGFNYSNVL